MSTRILENSRAVYEPPTHYEARSTSFSVFPQQRVEMQSSSVTSDGRLWQQVLVNMKNDNPTLALSNELWGVGIPALEHEQKNFALAQLLKSWHEGDELEQRETWERLKKALDEDRLSDRKLFP